MFPVSLDEVIAEVRRNRRVCPQPAEWQRLYDLLPGKRPVGCVWEPPLPHTGPIWRATSQSMKRLCLREHIEWAHRQGCLDDLFAFFKSIPEDRWHHTDE